MSMSRIVSICITPVAFADPPLLNAVGVHEPFAIRAVLELATEDGVVGLGETYGDEGHLEARVHPKRGAGRGYVAGEPVPVSPDRARERFDASPGDRTGVKDVHPNEVDGRSTQPFDVVLVTVGLTEPDDAVLGGDLEHRADREGLVHPHGVE